MVMINLSEEYEEYVNSAWIEQVVHKALETGADETDLDLTIQFTNDEEIHALNKEYLGEDSPTDVLSFPSGGEIDPETGKAYLGDIVISVPRAQLQSQESGHSLQDEMALLVTHGVLHLLGHDHAEPEEKEIMWQKQESILHSLGIQIPTR